MEKQKEIPPSETSDFTILGGKHYFSRLLKDDAKLQHTEVDSPKNGTIHEIRTQLGDTEILGKDPLFSDAVRKVVEQLPEMKFKR